MYKKIVISTSLITTLFLSGCGSQSPSETIVSEINSKNITGEKNITNLLFDYYKRAKNNIHKSNCSSLSASSDNALDNSIIELSSQYCNKDSELETKMKDILSKVNQAKSIDIKFEQIDGTSLYIDKGYTLEQAKILNKAKIDLDTIQDFEDLTKTKENVVSLVKHGINYEKAKEMKKTFGYYMYFSEMIEWLDYGFTTKEMKEWLQGGLRKANTMEKRLSLIKETGIKDRKEWEKWENNRVYSAESFLAWKKAGINNSEELKYVRKLYIRNPQELNSILSSGMKLKNMKDWYELGMRGNDIGSLFKVLKKHNYADLKNFEKFKGLHMSLFNSLSNAIRYNTMNKKVWNEFLTNKENLEKSIDKAGGIENINKWGVSPEEVIKLQEYGFSLKDFKDNNLRNKLRLVHDLMRNNVSVHNIIKASKVQYLDTRALVNLLKTKQYSDFDKALEFLLKTKLNDKKIRNYIKSGLLTEKDINTIESLKFDTQWLTLFQDRTGLKSSEDIKNFFIKNNIDYSDIIRFERLKFNTKNTDEYRKELLKWAKLMHKYRAKGYTNTASLTQLNTDFLFNTKDIDLLLQKGVIKKSDINDYYSNRKFFNEMKKVFEYHIGKQLHINSKLKQKEKFISYVKSGAHSLYSIMTKARRESRKKR